MTSVCVFLAGSRGNDPSYVAAARACGAGLAARGWRLVYGGAHRGLMGELPTPRSRAAARSTACCRGCSPIASWRTRA